MSLRILLLLAFILLTVSTASADINRFAGKWKNIDPHTGGITNIQIDVSGAQIRIETWGKCGPGECAWGPTEGTAYAPSVGSNLVETAETISAIYSPGWCIEILVIHPAEDGQISVEALTRFTDHSGRANMRRVYTLARA